MTSIPTWQLETQMDNEAQADEAEAIAYRLECLAAAVSTQGADGLVDRLACAARHAARAVRYLAEERLYCAGTEALACAQAISDAAYRESRDSMG